MGAVCCLIIYCRDPVAVIIRNKQCHGNLSPCLCAQNVAKQFMLLRRSLQVEKSGTWGVSSAVCATRCWTAPTTMPRTMSSTARHVMAEDLDLRVMDLVEVQVLSIWIQEKSLEIQSLHPTNLMILHICQSNQGIGEMCTCSKFTKCNLQFTLACFICDIGIEDFSEINIYIIIK